MIAIIGLLATQRGHGEALSGGAPANDPMAAFLARGRDELVTADRGAARCPAGPPPTDPLIRALARYVEALHRRYPEGFDEMRREALDSRGNMPTVKAGKEGSAA